MTVKSSTDVTTVVCQMFSETLEVQVTPDDDIRHLAAIDSLKLMRLVTRIEDSFGITLDDDAVFVSVTIGELIAEIERELAA